MKQLIKQLADVRDEAIKEMNKAGKDKVTMEWIVLNGAIKDISDIIEELKEVNNE